jgi:hypothetical protein
MAEWTALQAFDNVLNVDNAPQAGIQWSNITRALTVDDTTFANSFLDVGDYSDFLNFYNPKARLLVPVGSTIERIEIQLRMSEDSGDGVIDRIAFTQGDDILIDRNLSATLQTWTYDKTIAEWGLTQQQARDFLYANSSTQSFRVVGFSQFVTADPRCYWAQCRVNFTRLPNVPRTAFIGIF